MNYNAANCSPANNEPLADLTQYQVTESLASFNLQDCTNDFVSWAFPYAMQAQTDMVSVMTAPRRNRSRGRERHPGEGPAQARRGTGHDLLDPAVRRARALRPTPLPSLPRACRA